MVCFKAHLLVTLLLGDTLRGAPSPPIAKCGSHPVCSNRNQSKRINKRYRIVVSGTHLVETICISLHAITSILLEWLLACTFALQLFTVRVIRVPIGYLSLCIGQGNRTDAQIVMTRLVVLGCIFTSDQSHTVYIPGLQCTGIVGLYHYLREHGMWIGDFSSYSLIIYLKRDL